MLFVVLFVSTVVGLLLFTALLHAIPRVLGAGAGDWLAKAPGLDAVVFVLTGLPLLVPIAIGFSIGCGFLGILALALTGMAGQYVALAIWCRLHELRHRDKLGGARIVKSMNRAVGPLRNYFAVYWTALAVPVFLIVRAAELIVYPVLIRVIQLPRYEQGEWVNVTRHKFDNLVGGDRVWCLYCDWMTGVWSLGSEMLRNIESFWCPIRFGSDAKCDNCRIDFPDVDGGWVPFDSDTATAAAKSAEMYPGPGGVNGWFGHESRKPQGLTVEGEPSGVEASDR